jgi:hypothetical protein
MVMVGICLVFHLDGPHRSTVSMRFNTFPFDVRTSASAADTAPRSSHFGRRIAV